MKKAIYTLAISSLFLLGGCIKERGCCCDHDKNKCGFGLHEKHHKHHGGCHNNNQQTQPTPPAGTTPGGNGTAIPAASPSTI